MPPHIIGQRAHRSRRHLLPTRQLLATPDQSTAASPSSFCHTHINHALSICVKCNDLRKLTTAAQGVCSHSHRDSLRESFSASTTSAHHSSPLDGIRRAAIRGQDDRYPPVDLSIGRLSPPDDGLPDGTATSMCHHNWRGNQAMNERTRRSCCDRSNAPQHPMVNAFLLHFSHPWRIISGFCWPWIDAEDHGQWAHAARQVCAINALMWMSSPSCSFWWS